MYFNAKYPGMMKVTYTDVWKNAIAHAMSLPEVQRRTTVSESAGSEGEGLVVKRRGSHRVEHVKNVVQNQSTEDQQQGLEPRLEPNTESVFILSDTVPKEVTLVDSDTGSRPNSDVADFFLGNMMYWAQSASYKQFDLVMSNPPYIPKKSTELDGDRKNEQLWCSGTELILQLVNHTEQYVNRGGNLILYFSSVSWLDPAVVEAVKRASKTETSGKFVSMIYGEEHPFDVPDFDEVEFLLGLEEGQFEARRKNGEVGDFVDYTVPSKDIITRTGRSCTGRGGGHNVRQEFIWTRHVRSSRIINRNPRRNFYRCSATKPSRYNCLPEKLQFPRPFQNIPTTSCSAKSLPVWRWT